jgi:hypothetical protein
MRPPEASPEIKGLATHPDGSRTYTPGLVRRKRLAGLLGLAVFVFGCWWQWPAARLFLFGGVAEATVIFVLEEKPGQEAVKLDTRRAVSQAEDPTRNATYLYWVRFADASGAPVEAPLNYGQALRPLHSVGDRITVAYDPGDARILIDRWSVRTWAFGFFFMGVGALIAVPQFLILWAARRPILIDAIGGATAARGAESRAPGP